MPATGSQGIGQKQVFVHDDPDLVAGFPRRVDGASSAQPVFANLDGRPGDELIVATDAGIVHAYDARGNDIKGWPVRTPDAPWWPTELEDGARRAHRRARAPRSRPARPSSPTSTVTARSKSSSATRTATSGRGARTARRRPGFKPVNVDGRVQSGAHVDPAFSRDDTSTQDQFNRTKPGFASAPAAADLDGDGKLEIVGAALDRHVYAWHDDGTPVAGFPVLAVDPAKVECDRPGVAPA